MDAGWIVVVWDWNDGGGIDVGCDRGTVWMGSDRIVIDDAGRI